MSEGYSSSGYHIKLLKSENWMLWKHQMLAILWDLNLEKYIEKTAVSLIVADLNNPTKNETEEIDKWWGGDVRTQTWIELAIVDTEMIYISGALTVRWWALWLSSRVFFESDEFWAITSRCHSAIVSSGCTYIKDIMGSGSTSLVDSFPRLAKETTLKERCRGRSGRELAKYTSDCSSRAIAHRSSHHHRPHEFWLYS